MGYTVCHLTSVHPRYDTRILLKECVSLASNGYTVYLVVADGKGDEVYHGVRIKDVGLIKNRFGRMLLTPWRVYAKALSLNCSLCHLHDPELLLIAHFLKRAGKKVIFDSHEDVPIQILDKRYLPKFLRQRLSEFFDVFQKVLFPKLDGVVTATAYIAEKLRPLNDNITAVHNYFLSSPVPRVGPSPTTKAQVCYVGGLTRSRGIEELVRAMEFVKTDVKLVIGGAFKEP